MIKKIRLIKQVHFIILILFSVLFYSNKVHSQKLDNNNIPRYNTDLIFPEAPNAAAFNRYGKYPVDLSSGLVKIEVPIYTIKTSQLELPITLSYHSSGIKVNDIPSTIGLGWNLNAGGMLSINVRGYTDFDLSHKIHGDTIPTETGIDYMKDDGGPFLNFMRSMSDWQGAAYKYDTQSDMYSYSISGLISGAFTYDHKWNLVQIPESDNSVRRLEDKYGATTGYKIIGEDGVKYYFTIQGSSSASIEANSKTNSYYIEKIVSADSRDSIVFEYQESDSYTEYAPTFSAYRGRLFDISTGQVLPKIEYSELIKDFTNTKAYFNENILTKIKFNGGEIIFETKNDREDRMNIRHTGIKVKSTIDDAEVYHCSFLHDYFESEDEFSMKEKKAEYFKRLKLVGIDMNPTNTKDEKQSYYFYYNSMKLPAYDYSHFHTEGSTAFGYSSYRNYGQDLWGYYNGKGGQHLLVKSSSDTDELYRETVGITTDRSISQEHMKACTLEKIIYPTGGSSVFEHEAVAGGLRIGRISSYDHNSDFVEEKMYAYSEKEDISRVQVSDQFTTFKQGYWYYNINQGSTKYVKTHYTTNPYNYQIIGNANFYPKVTEYFGDKDNNYGKKEYFFQYEGNETDYLPGRGSEIYRYSTTIIDNYWRRGNLLQEKIYKKINSDYELTQMITNNYRLYKNNNYITGTIVTQSYIPTNHDTDCERPNRCGNKDRFRWFSTYASTGINKLVSTTTENYENGQLAQKEIVRYDYDKLLYSSNPHTQITRRTIAGSANDSIITTYKYPLDFEYKTQSGLDFTINQLFRKENVINTPVEIINYTKKGNNSPLVIDGYFYKYKRINQLAEKFKLSVDQPFYYNGASYIDNQGYNISSKYEKEIQFDYNEGNRIKEYIDKTDTPVSVLWSYNYRYPVSEVKNILYKDLEESLQTVGLVAEDLAKSQTPDMEKLKQLQAILPNSTVTIFDYNPLVGVKETVDPAGLKLKYSYDGFNRLEDISDHNNSLLNKYFYHYITVDPDKLDIGLLCKNQYNQYEKPTFELVIRNGSGNYSYNWMLKDYYNTEDIISNKTSNKFSYHFTKVGKWILSCTITDNVKGEERILSRNITVVTPPKLQIEEILPEKDSFSYGARVIFTQKSTGGSGDQNFNWMLKDATTEKILATNTTKGFDINLEKAGQMIVICTIKDTNTNEEVTKEKVVIVGTPPEIEEWRITPQEDQFGLNKTEEFIALVKGGTGKFSYSWELKNSTTGKILSTGTNKSFQVQFTEEGNMLLSCKIRDLGAAENSDFHAKSLNFKVTPSAPMIIKVIPEQLEYEVLDKVDFSVQVQDGSGNYTYNWQLKNISTGAIVQSGTNANLEVSFFEIGKYQLSCTVKDITKNITKEKIYSFDINPIPIEFKMVDFPPNQDPSQLDAEAYIYCSEDNTEIIFNLWINGHFNNNQEALFWIENQQYTRENGCPVDLEGKYPCLNSDESLSLNKGWHTIRVSLYNIDSSKITRAGILIKDASVAIGDQTYLSIGND